MATHNFDGRITALIPRANETFISLDLPAAAQPADGQFVLPVSHANYDSIYSLALAAAINRYTVRVRTTEDIDPGDLGEVMWRFGSKRGVTAYRVHGTGVRVATQPNPGGRLPVSWPDPVRLVKWTDQRRPVTPPRLCPPLVPPLDR
jgi:hypothetical protein